MSPRAIGGLALLAACLLAGMLAMSLELYESAKDWQKSALQQDFARTLSAASAVLSTGLPNFFAGLCLWPPVFPIVSL